jgi:uncharacterized repeat protein (TIGR03803 family)
MKLQWMFALALVVSCIFTTLPANSQTYSVLYNFGTRTHDPINPSGNLAQGPDGAMYGTSYDGGLYGQGTVFKVSTGGKVNVLHSFCALANCADGSSPDGGLTLRPDGHFMGTTLTGGSYGYGTIFEITQTGDLHVLYNFTGGADGAYPSAPPILGPDGSFYGTVTQGGLAPGCGTIYRITNSGATVGGFQLLHKFNNANGCEPAAALMLSTNGEFYGPAVYGGSAGYGVIFKITTAGKFAVLHNFEGDGDGYDPAGSLVEGSDGNFFGTTRGLNSAEGGGIFQMTPEGTVTSVHHLNGSTDGNYVSAGVIEATDGNFYGVAEDGGTDENLNCNSGCGTLFRTTMAGAFSVLYNFEFTTGYFADSIPFQHTNGMLYGDTYWGGITSGVCAPFGCGVFYRWDGHLPAFVSLVRYQGKVGSEVEILGQGFTASTTVSFNGVTAPATVVSGTFLRAVVPSGATTGPVTVTTPDGTLTSNQQFVVVPE